MQSIRVLQLMLLLTLSPSLIASDATLYELLRILAPMKRDIVTK